MYISTCYHKIRDFLYTTHTMKYNNKYVLKVITQNLVIYAALNPLRTCVKYSDYNIIQEYFSNAHNFIDYCGVMAWNILTCSFLLTYFTTLIETV